MRKKGIEEAKGMLRAAGLAATEQRIALLVLLQAAKHPLSAEAVATKLEATLALTTVYRALDQLAAAGLARRIDLGRNHALFESSDHHHHHIVCRSCGSVEDVTACVPKTLPKSVLRKAKRFAVIEDHALEFFGLCRACASKSR